LRQAQAPTVSIVVPVRNEARNLEVVLPGLPAVHEVILVDGWSVDDSVETARRILPEIKVIRQTRRGKGNALACGFEAATGDIIVTFDADGSADPTEIPAFVAALLGGAHYAKGSRFHAQGDVRGSSNDLTGLRRLGNAALNKIANALFGTNFSDLCYGYNAFWRAILPVLDLPPAEESSSTKVFDMYWGDGFEIETVINCRVAAANLRIAEVPSVERRRIFGQTNLRTFSDGSRVLRTLVAERWRMRRGQCAEVVTGVPEAQQSQPQLVADPFAALGGARPCTPTLVWPNRRPRRAIRRGDAIGTASHGSRRSKAHVAGAPLASMSSDVDIASRDRVVNVGTPTCMNNARGPASI
jgi:Glycosyl transferase family 2